MKYFTTATHAKITTEDIIYGRIDNKHWLEFAQQEANDYFRPKRVIYNPPYTICFFGRNGDEKVIAKCSVFDEYKPDFGVMACIMRRLFSTRAEFEKIVENGKWQEPRKEK